MARSRIPHLYGIFQFCCRLILVVVEVCALAALIILTMYNDSFSAGYVAVSLLSFTFLLPARNLS
jgi:hypothetical protein